MANLAIFASGTGSNFVAIADALAGGPHRVAVLVTDKPDAPVVERAHERDIAVYHADYRPRRARSEVEREIIDELDRRECHMIALAGFMKILTPTIIDRFPQRIVNIHPSLLPRHAGVGAIENSFNSGDTELGITIHFVDYGVDTGPIIVQRSFNRSEVADLQAACERIHALEHYWYPKVVHDLLDHWSQGATV